MEKQEYRQLAEMASDGDAKAFSHLYETIYREMYYTAYYSLKNDADAVSAVEETVRSGFSAASRLRTEAAFRSYMMKTLCTKIKRFFKEYAADGEPIEYNAAEYRPYQSGFDIKQEFARLPDSDRVITVMAALGSFTAEEIAGFLGMSAGAVRKRLKKTMAMICPD